MDSNTGDRHDCPLRHARALGLGHATRSLALGALRVGKHYSSNADLFLTGAALIPVILP